MVSKTMGFRFRIVLTLATLSCFVSAAQAQSDSWNVDLAGNWSTTGNWLGGTPPGTGGVATFGDSFGLSAGRTVTLDVNPTLSGITFNTPFLMALAGGTGLTINTGTDFTLNGADYNGSTPTLFGNGSGISGVIAGTANSFIKTGTGTVNLTGTNTFTAPIFLNQGEIRIGLGDATLGNAANTVTMNGGALRVSTTVLTTTRDFTIGASGGTLRAFVATNFNGNFMGSGTFTRQVTGVLTFNGNSSSFSGAVVNETGTIALAGASSSFAGTAGFDLSGTLFLNSATTNNNDRIADGRTITSRGSQIQLSGNAIGTTETIGTMDLAQGISIVTVVPNAAAATTLTLTNLTRNNRSTVFFRGTGLGSAPAANVGNVVVTNSPGTLIGGAGDPNTSTKASILPYAHGLVGTGTQGGSLVTWDSVTQRIVPLNLATGYTTTLAGSAFDDNVNISANDTVAGGGQTINALRVAPAAAITISGGAGDALTLNSGVILNTSTTGTVLTTIAAPVTFAAGVEGILHANGGAVDSVAGTFGGLQIDGVIAGSNGLTKGGVGVLALSGLNTYTGTTTLGSGSTLMRGNATNTGAASIFGTSTSTVVMTSNAVASNFLLASGGSRNMDRNLQVITGASGLVQLGAVLGTDSLTVNGTINIVNPNNALTTTFLQIAGTAATSGSVTLNGNISGGGGILTSANASSITINGNNSYSGGTNLSGTTPLNIGHDNAFGTGIVYTSAIATLNASGGARTLGNAFGLQSDIIFGGTNALTLSGAVDLRAGPRTLTVNTTGANVTLGGVVGRGSLIKAGAGTLVMSNTGNNYTGSTVVRNGTLVIGGNALYGSGVLGTNPNTTLGTAGTVALGDATTAAADNVSLLTNGAFTVARSIQVNAQNSTGTTTIGGTNTSGSAIYSGQINLSRATTNFTAAAGGRVDYTGQITQTIAAAVNFVGGGTQNLSAANTYAGTTTVVGGILLANNTLGSATGTGNVVVNPGTTLGGAGFIVPGAGNTVTINGTVAPGNSAGTLTIGSVGTPTTATLAGTYAFELALAGTGGAVLNSGTSSPSLPHLSHDVLNVFGTLNLTGSTINLVASAGTGFNSAVDYSWLVGTTNGGTLNGLSAIGSVGGGDFTGLSASSFSVGNVGGNFYLNYTSAIPEPGTLGLLALGMLMFTARRRMK